MWICRQEPLRGTTPIHLVAENGPAWQITAS
jgi:hypothetical protein